VIIDNFDTSFCFQKSFVTICKLLCMVLDWFVMPGSWRVGLISFMAG